MEKFEVCNLIGVKYEESDTIEMQGKRKDAMKYPGYYIKEERNGYWVLVKPSRVIVQAKSSVGMHEANLKQELLDFYGKQRISTKQVSNFVKDVEKKEVNVCLSKRGNLCIQKGTA